MNQQLRVIIKLNEKKLNSFKFKRQQILQKVKYLNNILYFKYIINNFELVHGCLFGIDFILCKDLWYP